MTVLSWKDRVKHHVFIKNVLMKCFCFTEAWLSGTILKYRLAKLRGCRKGLKILLPREAKDHNGNTEVLGF